jgi:hypothetical protein
MTREIRKSCEPAKLLRSNDLPAFAPVAGTSLLWVSNTDDDPFPKATGAFFHFATALHKRLPHRHIKAAKRRKTVFCSTNFVSSPRLSTSSLRSRAQASSLLRRTPTTAPSGEAPLCMVHKVAQEASRRMTPARALTHAVAPPLDRTYPSMV